MSSRRVGMDASRFETTATGSLLYPGVLKQSANASKVSRVVESEVAIISYWVMVNAVTKHSICPFSMYFRQKRLSPFEVESTHRVGYQT